MPLLEFPAASFEVDGEPEAIRETARSYGRFATITGQAATDIRNLSSGEWEGSEGDIFRTGVAELPPHFDTAHTAFGQVSQALSGFAGELESLKSRMRTLRADARQTFTLLRSAQQSQEGLKEPTAEQLKENPALQAGYDQQKQTLDSRVSGLETTWQRHLTSAGGLRAQAHEAAGRTGQAIRAAGRTSPTADQNWLERNLEKAGNWIGDRIEDLKNFIREHANVFRWIATALKWVGGALMAVAAVLAGIALFIPLAGWLAEIPIGAVFAVGGFLFGAGDALDTTVDWAEGKISGKELLLRAGLSLVLSFIGAGAGKLLGPVLERLGPKVRKWLDDILGRGGRTPDPPSKKPPGLDGNPLNGGTRENPRRYEYRNPAENFRNAPEPTPRDLRNIRGHRNYQPGTREHMLARWKEYMKTHPEGGQSWEQWRDGYIRNQGHDPRGTAYERAFYDDHGFSEADGWATNTNVKDITGGAVDRNYDILNAQTQTAYELKSGGTYIDPKQLAKDQQLVQRNWRVVYIFGADPDPAVARKLTDAGIPYQVWHGDPVVVP